LNRIFHADTGGKFMIFKLPASAYNYISFSGAVIALISLFMIVFLFVISTVFGAGGSYLGLIVYILLPGIMMVGLLMIPLGMMRALRKQRKTGEITTLNWPVINLNEERHRNAFLIFSVGTAVFLFLSAVGSYEAFHYTESVSFCGTICHSVMHPEYTAYQSSPHARVACVECHVGEGADWFVRSKISGLYQVYAVMANVYPKPIPTPIRNLRPARETCEKCHWPQKFYSTKLRVERHYLNDELNSQWDIHLNMKIGAGHSALGLAEGIHWHINPSINIEFASADERKEDILWIRKIDGSGHDTTLYLKNGAEAEPPAKQIYTMDCMDCHNRPSHSYRPPAFFVNEAITAGQIPAGLPQIKSLAMEICGNEFSTSDSAMTFIRESILNFYQENYKDTSAIQKELIEQAITGLQNVYASNIFPEMRVRWDRYPNQIGHMEFNGCFRCHNNEFSSKKGRVITKDCNLCHQITAQGNPTVMQAAAFGQSLEFQHPVDIDDAWKEGLCTDCHTGLNP